MSPPSACTPPMCRFCSACSRPLIEHGATVIVIEHDLDVIRNADYIIDMGPGGGAQGGTVVAAGTPDVIRHTPRQPDRQIYLILGQYRIILSADTASEVRQMPSQKRR